MMPALRVAIAERPVIQADALQGWLAGIPGLCVVAAATAHEALAQAAARERAQVAVLDLNSVLLQGPEPVALMQHAGVRVIALCSSPDRSTIAGVIRAGVDGFVAQTPDRAGLAAVIRRVARDGHYIGIEVAQAFADPFLAADHYEIVDPQDWHLDSTGAHQTHAGDAAPDGSHDRSAGAIHTLTKRERQVLCLVATGHNSQSIAGRLVISVPTVRKHRENLARKLGLHNVAEATAFVIRNGLLMAEAQPHAPRAGATPQPISYCLES